MRLIHHDHAVMRKVRVELHLLKKDAIGHYLYGGIGRGCVFKPHLVSDNAWNGRIQLARDEVAHRQRRDASGLGNADYPFRGIARLIENDGELCGFSRPSGTLNDNDLVRGESLKNFGFLLIDRQIVRMYHMIKCNVREELSPVSDIPIGGAFC